MSHDLNLRRLCINDKCTSSCQIPSEFGTSLTLFLFFGLFNQALASQGQMLSKLNIFLLPSELFNFLLHTFHKIFSDSIFGCSRFADTQRGIWRTQIQLLENLILSNGILSGCLSSSVRAVLILVEVSKKPLLLYFWLAELLKNLETTWKATTFLEKNLKQTLFTFIIRGWYTLPEVSGRITSSFVPTLGACVAGSRGPILIPVKERPRSAI